MIPHQSQKFIFIAVDKMKNFNFGIQVLRGVAALLVVVDHLILRITRSHGGDSFWGGLAGDLGAFGVYIFFVISGYIISSTTFNNHGLASSINFIKNRFIRIAPLYWIATFFSFLLSTLSEKNKFDAIDVLCSLFFVPWPSRPEDGPYVPIHGVGWSLNYEFYFYIIFSLSMITVKKFRLFFVILFALFPVFLFFTIFKEKEFVKFYIKPLILLFIFGVIIEVFLRHFKNKLNFAKINFLWPYVSMASLLFIILLNKIIPGYYPGWRTLSLYWLSAFLVFLSAIKTNFQEKIYKKLLLVGDASYSIYLFHGFFLSFLNYMFFYVVKLNLSHQNVVFYFFAAIFVSIFSGKIIHEKVERPLNLFVRKIIL